MVDYGFTFWDYVKEARKTAIYPGKGDLTGLLYTSIGLGGEAGELLNKVKKVLRDNNGFLTEETKAALAGELGDILWYVAAMCDEIGYAMENVAWYNIVKLAERMKNDKIKGDGDNR